MKLHPKKILFFSSLIGIVFPALVLSEPQFVPIRSFYDQYLHNSSCILIASPGRSGSTMLHNNMRRLVRNHLVGKTHLLPPEKSYIGKIVFIYSNPNKAAESALHETLYNAYWGECHFQNFETSDNEWLAKIKDTTKQTIDNNLLTYDALGCYKLLKEWLLLQTYPSSKSASESQILAIKYENLWDSETLEALKVFLQNPDFTLPSKKDRGNPESLLSEKEIEFRTVNNKGTWDDPLYPAYEAAKTLWESMPPFQFLELKEKIEI